MKTLHALSAALLAGACALLASATTAHADDLLFVRVSGQKQGEIKRWWNPFVSLGGVDITDAGLVDDLSWSVLSPRDPASGLPTGKRMHRPLTLRLRMSSATLQLGMALTDNENLTDVKVQWFTTGDLGDRTLTRELVLVNANISAFSTYTAREGTEKTTYVDVSMTYQRIGINDYVTGVAYMDDWEAPL